jgi:hypothetical protein
MWIFTEEHATAFVRTVMPMVWGFLITRFPAVMDFLTQFGLTEEAAVLIVSALVYSAIRWAAQKFPAVGWLLGINKKPHYTGVVEQPVGEA